MNRWCRLSGEGRIATQKSGDKTPARRVAEEGPGLAATYPGDRGIEKNLAVIYATGFEKGIRVEILEDAKIARVGKACAKITATRGEDTGGELHYTWKKGVDRCRVRFSCRFDKDSVTPHHSVNMGGHMPTYKYRFGGGAGIRPPGGADGKFGTTIEPPQLDRAQKGRKGWMFYTYRHEMRSWQTPHGASEGQPIAYYGNNFLADGQRPFIGRDKWICVAFMVQLNRIGERDGEQAVWIDKRLQINRAMLQWYVSDRAAKKGRSDKNIVYFDNLVIATRYIGPMAEIGSAGMPKGKRPEPSRK